MTAKQKFEARLKETGLYDEWTNIGGFGRVAKQTEDGTIVLFVHESEDDAFSEVHYPSFSELRENPAFVKGFLRDMDCFNNGDWKRGRTWTEQALAWLLDENEENPLDPVDIYFPASGLNTHYENFTNDTLTAKEKFYRRLEEEGLTEEMEREEVVGKVDEKTGEIIVFIHHGEDYPYYELRYPSYEELRKNPVFCKNCEDNWFGQWDDDKFIASLAIWLTGKSDECPLCPVDVYWLENVHESKTITFKDGDEDEIEVASSQQLQNAVVKDYVNNPSLEDLRKLISLSLSKSDSPNELEMVVEDENCERRPITYAWFDRTLNIIRLTIGDTEFEDHKDAEQQPTR